MVHHRLDWQTYPLVEANDQLLHLHDERLSVVISTRGNVPAIVYWGSFLGHNPIHLNLFTRGILGGGIDLDPPLGINAMVHTVTNLALFTLGNNA